MSWRLSKPTKMCLRVLQSFLMEKTRTRAISVLFTTVPPTPDKVPDTYMFIKHMLNHYMNEYTKRVVSLSVTHMGMLAGGRDRV